MDKLAAKAGIDPLEFREKSYAEHDQNRRLPITTDLLISQLRQAFTSFRAAVLAIAALTG